MSDRIAFDNFVDGESTTLGDLLNSKLNAIKTVANQAMALIGDWDSSTNYYTNDVSKSGGRYWLALQDSLNVTPVEGAYWTAITVTTAVIQAMIDASVIGLFDYKGNIDCSGNPNYPSASKGDVYRASFAGRIGGVSGKQIDANDFAVALADNAGGTEASVGTSWAVWEHNLVNALIANTDGSYTIADISEPGTTTNKLYSVATSILKWAGKRVALLASSLTSGRIPFADGSGNLADDSALNWDNTFKLLGIGTTTPGALLDAVSETTPTTFFAARALNASASGGANQFGYRARGTKASPAAVQSNDYVSLHGGCGHDGSDWEAGRAFMLAQASENHSPSAQGTRLMFYVVANGSTTPVAVATLDQDQVVKLFKQLRVPEISTPSTPPSGHGYYYFKSDNQPYAMGDDGVERNLLGGVPNATEQAAYLNSILVDPSTGGILTDPTTGSVLFTPL